MEVGMELRVLDNCLYGIISKEQAMDVIYDMNSPWVIYAIKGSDAIPVSMNHYFNGLLDDDEIKFAMLLYHDVENMYEDLSKLMEGVKDFSLSKGTVVNANQKKEG